MRDRKRRRRVQPNSDSHIKKSENKTISRLITFFAKQCRYKQYRAEDKCKMILQVQSGQSRTKTGGPFNL